MTFARKYVVLIAWANAPNIPSVVGDLFRNVEGTEGFPPMRETDRRLGYNVTYNMVYDMGYDPNINIVTDGFGRTDVAVREWMGLIAYRATGKIDELLPGPSK